MLQCRKDNPGNDRDIWFPIYGKAMMDLYVVLAGIQRSMVENKRNFCSPNKEKDVLYRLTGRTIQLLWIFSFWMCGNDNKMHIFGVLEEMCPDYGKVTGELSSQLESLSYEIPAHDPTKF
jgi:hypothetical protein